MSNSCWEAGTIKLPTVAAAKIRHTLTDASNAYHTDVLTECLRLWNGPLGQTRSVKLYKERLAAAPYSSILSSDVLGDAWDVMGRLAGKTYPERKQLIPRTPRASDVDKVAPRGNSRTAKWHGGEWIITLRGVSLHYSSGENNHQIERAREHPVVATMFRELERTAWTRATGGQFFGNDEINREENRGAGSGDYVTRSYGPIGEAADSWRMRMPVKKLREMRKPVAPKYPFRQGW